MPLKRFFALNLILLIALTATAQQARTQKKDSLWDAIRIQKDTALIRSYNRLTNLYFAEAKNSLKFDTLITLYAEMDAKVHQYGIWKHAGVIRGNKLSLYLNNGMYQRVIDEAPTYLDFLADKELWSYYYYCAGKLVQAYMYTGKTNKALETAETAYKLASKINNKTGMALMSQSIAAVYDEQGRHTEEEKYLRQAIDLLEGNKDMYAAQTKLYHDLCDNLLGQKKLDEILPIATRFEEVNLLYEDFIGTSVPTTWGNLYGILGRYYLAKEAYNTADEYASKIDSVIDNRRYRVISQSIRACTNYQRGKFEEALTQINEALTLSDSLSAAGNSKRAIKTKILVAMDRYKEAYELLQVTTQVTETLRSKEYTRQLDELHTRYEVDRYILEKEHQRTYTLAAIAGCVLLLIIILIIGRYNRRLQAKNRRLYKQIQENLRQSKQAEQQLATAPTETLTREAELYRRLNELMQAEHLFTNPNMDRRTLADRLGTNERYLADAIHEQADETVGAYLGRLRLQYALQLLNLHPNLTLDAVATDSGHTSYSTFYRAFGKMYGMSPSEYRKISAKKDI